VIRATHPRYVLDASVAAKWFTRHDESERHKAIALRELHQSGRCTLVVTEFSILEILNAVRFSGRAEEADASRALGFLERLHLEIVPLDWELLRKATAIAWAYQVALYDSAYVALAERQGYPLLTADEAMFRRMKGHSLVLRLQDLDFS
jgi:predicted nucleic acid-binding protein